MTGWHFIGNPDSVCCDTQAAHQWESKYGAGLTSLPGKAQDIEAERRKPLPGVAAHSGKGSQYAGTMSDIAKKMSILFPCPKAGHSASTG
ncbi:MAG: hypothetical protein OXG15_10915 [Gammaproteobacteria bacterium]|nr:hypothetical protein [Gammaproteobacteria bacterium]